MLKRLDKREDPTRVSLRLMEDGNRTVVQTQEKVEKVEGGYLFRGTIVPSLSAVSGIVRGELTIKHEEQQKRERAARAAARKALQEATDAKNETEPANGL